MKERLLILSISAFVALSFLGSSLQLRRDRLSIEFDSERRMFRIDEGAESDGGESSDLSILDPGNDEKEGNLNDFLLEIELELSYAKPLIQVETREIVPRSVEETHYVHLGPIIATTGTSTVFTVFGRPDLIIKYQGHWCGGTYSSEDKPFWKVHPVVREFYFLSILAPLGIAPEVHAISRPAVIRVLNDKTTFDLQLETFTEFMSKSPILRYIVMERTGASIHTFLQEYGAQSIEWSLELGIEILTMLRILHEKNIIHGDVHQGNVVFKEPLQTMPRIGMKLIDFGKSVYAKTPIDCFEDVERVPPHPMYTPWMMENRTPSYRDDVYQALQIVATAMSGPELFEAMELNASQLSWETNYRLKMYGSIFSYGRFMPLLRAPPRVRDIILRIEHHVKQLRCDQPLNFDEVLLQLSEAQQILRAQSGVVP